MDFIRSSSPEEGIHNQVTAVDLTANPQPTRNAHAIGDDRPGVFETAGSFYQNETLFGSASLMLQEVGHGDGDPTFNIYRHYLDNKDDLQDMEVYVRQGMFDSVENEWHFNQRTQRLRTELQNRKNMANGSLTGNMLGMGLSLLDIMTIVPYVGQVRKGKSAMTALDYGLKSGAVVAGQEVLMHQMQDFRTMEESAFNVAAAGALMSAVGFYKGHKAAGGATITDGVKSANETIRKGSKVASDYASIAYRELKPGATKGAAEGDSVGAAKVSDGTASVMEGNRGKVANAVDKTTSWIDETTPVGRSFKWSLPEARQSSQGMMDTGGRINKDAADGVPTQNAESVKNAIKSEYESLLLRSENKVRDINLQMAGIKQVGQQLRSDWTRLRRFGQSVAGKEETYEMGLLQTQDFNRLITNTLHDYVDGDYLKKLETSWGKEKADIIVNAANQMANDIKASNRHLEDLMVEHGLITESQRLGDNYKMAQLWNSKAIDEDSYKARDFFLKVFQEKPADDFLEDFGLTPEQYNKLGLEDVAVGTDEGAEVISKADGIEIKRSILEEWAGDTFEKNLAKAEMEAEAALTAEKEARKGMVEAAALLRMSTTETKNLSIKRAKEFVQKSYEKLAHKQAERQSAKATLQEAQAELKGSMHKEYAQKIALVESGPTQRALNAANSKLRKLDKTKDPLEQDPAAYRKAQEELVEAEIKHAVAIDDAWRKIKVNTPEMAKYKEKALEARRQIRKAEGKIKKQQAKVNQLEESIGKTEAAVKASRSLTKESRKAYKALRSEWLKSKKGAKRSDRVARRTRNAKNMVETIDEMLEGMKHSPKSPQGVLHETMFEGGRSKSRKIHLTPEQTKEAHDLGILQDDLFYVLEKQWDEVSARIALKKVFGKDVKLDLSDIKENVGRQYDEEINFRRNRNKKSSHLINEKQAYLKDMDGLLDRLYGRAGMPDDPDSAVYWASGKAREYNFVRFGLEFILTSITDPANMILTNGYGVYARKYFKESSRILKDAPDDVVHKIATATERILHNSRHLKLSGSDSFNHGLGIGPTDSAKQKITSGVDRATGGMSEKVNVLSGLSTWNVKQKAMTMIFQQDKLVDVVLGNAKLSDRDLTRLATLGIGPDQIATFRKMAREFDVKEEGGLKSFGAERWASRNEEAYLEARKAFNDTKQAFKDGDIKIEDLDAAKATLDDEYAKFAEGRDAHLSLIAALRQAADRAIMTPGIGDTPLLMDGPVYKAIMQFQTYGFVIMNKMIAPAAQRMHTYKDAEALASIGMAIGLGGLVVITKDLLRDGEVKDRSSSEWMRDIMDRSGMLAWISPYAAAFEKTTGLGSGGSRFQANNTLGQLFGPTMGLASDVATGVNSLSNPDQDSLEKMRRLAPYQAVFKLADLTTEQ